jgi:hypothetical protein
MHAWQPAVAEAFLRYEGPEIRMPARFRPEGALLAYHRERIFKG